MLLALTASDINDHQGNERVYTPVYGSGAGITVGWKWLESVAEMHLLPYNNRMNYDLSVCTNAGPKIFFFRPYVGAGYLYQRTSLKEMEKIQTDHDLRLNLGIITNEIVALEWVAMMGGNPAWRFRLAFLFPV